LLLDISPRNTPPWWSEWGSSLPPDCFVCRGSISYIYIYISVFGKRLSRKGNNVVVFPFAFHIAVQLLFKPLWSRLLLYDLEPSQASFALHFKSLLMTLLWASEEFLLKFPSSRYLFSSSSYPIDLSSLRDPAGSKATAGVALRATGTHKPLHHDKV
jgi:hypothetical protein